MATSDDHFLDWLGVSACRFARVFAGKKGIWPNELLGTFAPSDVDGLNTWLDGLAKRKEVGLILWPLLRTADDVASVVRTLQTNTRWECTIVPWDGHKHPQVDHVLVAINWRTPNGDLSSAMGFAPLGCMPVTRRGPYVALAIWPGGHDNTDDPGRASPQGRVGFVDCKMPEGAKEYVYSKLWDQTIGAVKALLAAPPPEDRKVLHDVSFCLPTAAVGGLFKGD